MTSIFCANSYTFQNFRRVFILDSFNVDHMVRKVFKVYEFSTAA